MPQDFDGSCLGFMSLVSAEAAEVCIRSNAATRFLQLRDQVRLDYTAQRLRLIILQDEAMLHPGD